MKTDVRAPLETLLQLAHQKMAISGAGSRGWRRIYTDTSILLAFAALLHFGPAQDRTYALDAISHLDHAIVIAAAPGEGRMDLVLDLVGRIQSECLDHTAASHQAATFAYKKHPLTSTLSPPLASAPKTVPRCGNPPSLSTFISRLSQQPFVLPGFLSEWPALNEHPWSSLDYLRSVAGPGRVVPVEVGSDYRSDDWTQKMMPWDEFLSALEASPSGTGSRPILYLAQHSLFNQFPTLKDDIFAPDYVYCELAPPANYPQYAPPANEERLVLNAWLGPKGTVSPAHTVSAMQSSPWVNLTHV